jgi:hypothetical protein
MVFRKEDILLEDEKYDDTWDFAQECVNKEGGVACACARGFLPHPFNTSACQDIGRGTCFNLLFYFKKDDW